MGASVQLSSHSAAFEAPDHIGMTPRLSLRNITKRYPGITANDHVSLDIAPGEVLAILGENGAGKSTLMKIIYGAARPDEGEISFDGHPLGVETPAQARELGIAMVHQHFALFDTLSVTENVALGLSTGISAAEIEREIHLLGEKYGLEVDPASVVMELSMGERQRVEILRALMTKPKLLILDEPTSVLTPQAVRKLFKTLHQLSSEGVSILFISHKLDEIRELADRCVVLRAGKVVASVDPKAESEENLARLMIGNDPPTVREGTAKAGEVVFEMRHVRAPGSTRVCGIEVYRLPCVRVKSLALPASRATVRLALWRQLQGSICARLIAFCSLIRPSESSIRMPAVFPDCAMCPSSVSVMRQCRNCRSRPIPISPATRWCAAALFSATAQEVLPISSLSAFT